jgi:hypothetical protein
MSNHPEAKGMVQADTGESPLGGATKEERRTSRIRDLRL